MPSTSGTRKAPAGMRSQRAMIGPMMASARVSASGSQATVGNQTMSSRRLRGRHAEQPRHEGGDAATSTTRRYCMKATSRASAP